jgi:hypothetical protein
VTEVGYLPFQQWRQGVSCRLGPACRGPADGWRLLFADACWLSLTSAWGPDQYAAYMENTDGYEVELVG